MFESIVHYDTLFLSYYYHHHMMEIVYRMLVNLQYLILACLVCPNGSFWNSYAFLAILLEIFLTKWVFVGLDIVSPTIPYSIAHACFKIEKKSSSYYFKSILKPQSKAQIGCWTQCLYFFSYVFKNRNVILKRKQQKKWSIPY